MYSIILPIYNEAENLDKLIPELIKNLNGIVFENIFDERLDDVSTFKFKVTGSVEEPSIKRLN